MSSQYQWTKPIIALVIDAIFRKKIEFLQNQIIPLRRALVFSLIPTFVFMYINFKEALSRCPKLDALSRQLGQLRQLACITREELLLFHRQCRHLQHKCTFCRCS